MDDSEYYTIGWLRWLLLGSIGFALAGCSGSDLGQCTSPEPISDEYDSGLERCQEGYLHRLEDNACPVVPYSEPTDEYADYCESDDECGGGQWFCAEAEYVHAETGFCRASCSTDEDCADGGNCVCGERYGRCVSGRDECSSDADCEGEALCIGVFIGSGCQNEVVTFRCQAKKDECYDDRDCPSGQQCRIGEKGTECYKTSLICGRPFVVQQQPRLAAAARRADWGSGSTSVGLKSGAEASAAAAFFESIALMEHASIAAFARFSLNLLSLGAPAELIERTNDALRDETEHARLAFGLVGRFSGIETGPGPLSLEGCTLRVRPEELLELTIIEGCIGETIAALEASSIAAHSQDEEVKTIFAKIAIDESEHASLAWRTVRWLLDQYPHLEKRARDTFRERCATEDLKPALSAVQEGIFELGIPDQATRSRLRQLVLKSIIRPCASVLFKSVVTSSTTATLATSHPTGRL